ncbi:MAG TPA: YncE family protein, partial [Vicinamibacterales bacterium]|nr:YncE family protein [Vicinamibacterales bacterium]
MFSTAVKTDANGEVITNVDTPGPRQIVGAEDAGMRAGLERFTKIMFSAQYSTGRPGHRLDPNNPIVESGGEHWPFVKQPMRSWPNALAVTADGTKLYVTLPGREGYPDSRVAVVNTATRRVTSWIELRPAGQKNRTRPDGVAISPLNAAIFPRPYVVVTNEYANFASVIDTGNDSVIGEFNSGFYGEDLIFNADGTRLYITDRFNDQVRAFAITHGTSGPSFAEIAEIPTGNNDLDRSNPRDLTISADGKTLYVANTLGHTIAVVNIAGDANKLVRTMPVGGLSTDVKVAGRWGIVSGHETNNFLNQPETGHGMPKIVDGVAVRNTGKPLGYLPVMTDATKATTFDDIGTELNVFDT